MTSPDDSPRSAAGLVGRAAGAFVLDLLLNGAVFFSLITVIAGVLTREPAWVALGVVVGLAGMALPWYAMARKWRDSRAWLVAAGVLVVEIATMAVIWFAA
ncbi:MAG: hypothetical protein U0R80_10120 [Nocardioidaceae bacterium]